MTLPVQFAAAKGLACCCFDNLDLDVLQAPLDAAVSPYSASDGLSVLAALTQDDIISAAQIAVISSACVPWLILHFILLVTALCVTTSMWRFHAANIGTEQS